MRAQAWEQGSASPPTRAPTAAAQSLRHRAVVCAAAGPISDQKELFTAASARLFIILVSFYFILFHFGGHAAAPPSARADVDLLLVEARAMGGFASMASAGNGVAVTHPSWRAERTACSSMLHATCAMQHAASQNAIRNVQRQRPTCRTRRVPCNMQRVPCNVRWATMQPTGVVATHGCPLGIRLG